MPKRYNQPVLPSNPNESKVSQTKINYSERPRSLATMNITRKECPDTRSSNGQIVPDVTARVRGALKCRGTRGVGKGRALFAARALKRGEIFTCKRVRIYLRRTIDEEPNMWAVCAHGTQKTMVCRSICKTLPKNGEGTPWKDYGPGTELWAGPPRADKGQGHGYKASENTPPDERSAEMIFCMNSSKKLKKETNAELYIKTNWPMGQGKGICVPTFNIKILCDVEEGQEIKAYYNFREEKYY